MNRKGFQMISKVRFASVPVAQTAQYKLQEFKWNICDHHKDEGGRAKLTTADGKDMYVMTGPKVASEIALVKVLGENLLPGQGAIQIPQEVYEGCATLPSPH